VENLLIGLFGSLIALDTTVAFQFLISQPLIACTVLGWILGDVQLGLQVGIYLQLLWLSSMPVGAAIIPEGNVAAIVTAALTIRYTHLSYHFYTVLVLAIMYGLLISYIAGEAVVLDRKLNNRFMNRFQQILDQGIVTFLGRVHFLSLGAHFLLMFVLIYLSLLVGDWLFGYITLIPASWDNVFRYGSIAVLGIGVGLALPLFKEKNYRPFLAAGLITGGVLFQFVR